MSCPVTLNVDFLVMLYKIKQIRCESIYNCCKKTGQQVDPYARKRKILFCLQWFLAVFQTA